MTAMTWNTTTEAFELEVEPTADCYITFSDVASAESWDAFNGKHRYAPAEGNTVPTLDEQVQLQLVNDGNVKLAPGKYKLSVTKDLKLTVTGTATIIEPDYYVVGSSTTLGLDWTVKAANKMEVQTDASTNAKTYIKKYTNVTFAASEIFEWKIGGSTDGMAISTWYPSGDNCKATVPSAGTWDVTFICKPSMGFVDIDIQESSSLPVEDEGIIIKWDAPAAAGSLAAEYGVNPDFYMTWVDTNNNKLSIDANTAYFGDATSQKMFTHRFKTGGSSGNKNNITLHVGEAGKLRVYVRTGSNSATDRTLVLKQNGAELYSAVVQESDAIEVNEEDQNVKAPALADGDKKKVYPIIEVEVEEGEVSVEYPVNSLNFYAFQLIPDTGTGIRIIESDEQPMFNEALPAYNLQGQRVTKSYRGIVIQNGRKFYNK